ncbi:MAG: hypothetical protein ABW360_09275 [Phenylobacterium sp.]
MSRLPLPALTIIGALAACAPVRDPPAAAAYAATTAPRVGDVIGTDTSGKGAIYCSWMMYDAVLDVAERCFPDRDAALRLELARSLARTDRFIIANSETPITQEQLDARRAAMRAETQRIAARSGDMCRDPEMLRFYEAFRALGADKIRAGNDDLLSIPRKPVADPCV